MSVTAAVMQAVRTAAQKDLNRSLSTLVTTYVRSLFGLPFLFVYLFAVMAITGSDPPQLHGIFLMHSLAAAMRELIENQSMRDRLAAAGPDTVRRYTSAQAATAHRRIYDRLTMERQSI